VRLIKTGSASDIVAALKPTLGSMGESVLLDSVNRIKPAISATGRVGTAELATTF
jgi:hypothetical protein